MRVLRNPASVSTSTAKVSSTLQRLPTSLRLDSDKPSSSGRQRLCSRVPVKHMAQEGGAVSLEAGKITCCKHDNLPKYCKLHAHPIEYHSILWNVLLHNVKIQQSIQLYSVVLRRIMVYSTFIVAVYSIYFKKRLRGTSSQVCHGFLCVI